MWELQLSEEQAMIAEAVRDYLASELPLERLRPKAAPRDLAEVHRGMAELGWFGLGLAEAAGGSGLGLVEEMLIQRECGRYLVSPSVLATVLGAHVALLAGDAALATELAAGEASAALAVPATEPSLDRAKAYAFDWRPGELLLAWTEAGMGLFPAESFGEVLLHDSLDESVTAHAGLLAFDQTRCWVSATEAPLALRAKVLLAARLVGLAEQACELTVDYAKVRQQFGQPIGAFQAVKHRCADMALRARLSWDLTSLAALKVQAEDDDAPLQAAAAKLSAAHAAHENARAAIQLHGGIGYHAECDVHWFMKRAHLYDQAGGAMAIQARSVVEAPSPFG
jgi:alkylation response protein AidB-like acyl-CoA dehydrogenase